MTNSMTIEMLSFQQESNISQITNITLNLKLGCFVNDSLWLKNIR